jgi:hypothetical protein
MSYLTYNGKKIEFQGKFVTKAISPEILYLGTSSNGYILKSIDSGISFTIDQSLGLGVPVSCTKYNDPYDNILWFATNNGYALRALNGVFSNYSFAAPSFGSIYANEFLGGVAVGGEDGTVFYSNDTGDSWQDLGTGAPWGLDFVNGFSWNDSSNNLLVYTTSGVYYSDGLDASGLIQSGNFTTVCEAIDGSVYAGTQNGHIWKSTNSGASWSDLGEKSGDGYDISFVIQLNNGRFILGRTSGYGMFYTDDDFANMQQVGINEGHPAGVWVGGNIVVAGTNTGKVVRSIDNGSNWTEISGNPQQGESGIYSLLKA